MKPQFFMDCKCIKIFRKYKKSYFFNNCKNYKRGDESFSNV